MTPYDRLRSLPDAARFLKPGVDFALLDAVAAAETDLEAARRVQPNAARCSGASATAWPPSAPQAESRTSGSGTAVGRRERLRPRRVNPLRGSSASLRPFG